MYVTPNTTYPNAQNVNYETPFIVPEGLAEYPEEYVITYGIYQNPVPSGWEGFPQPYSIVPITINSNSNNG